MVEKNRLDDQELDAVFAAAAQNPPTMSADLFARIVQDAKGVSADAVAATVPATPSEPTGFFAALIETIGGWRGVAGLATATLAGVWIGVAQPDTITGLTGGYVGDITYFDPGDLIPSIEYQLTEG